MKTCLKCNASYPEDHFYNLKSHHNKDGKYPYCKFCSTKLAKEKQARFKTDCLTYKGCKCSVCGYNKSISALEFHHLNPLEKEFSISSIKSTKLTALIKKELDKCIVVCRNCHAEIHYTL